MARIDYYKYDAIITENDILLGSSYVTTGPNGPEYETSRYTIGSLGAYFSTFLYQGGEAYNINELEGRITTNETDISSLVLGLSTTNNNVSLLSSRVSDNEDEIDLINSKLVDVVNDISVTDGYAEYVRTVTIPNDVIEIEDGFMPGEKVKSIILNDGLEVIGAFSFNGNKIISLSIPSTVTNIKNNAFQSNRLDSITIPESVSNIGYSAFSINNGLTYVSVNGPSSIDKYAFAGSNYSELNNPSKKGFSELYIADGATFISDQAFNRHYYDTGAYYDDLTTSQVIENLPVTTSDSISNYFTYAVDKSYENEPGTASIPNINIPNLCFTGCYFSSFVIRENNSDNISIGESAFALNSQLTNFTFKPNITSIGQNAFRGTAIETLDLSLLTSTTFSSYCFNYMYRLSSVILPSNIVLSQGMFMQSAKLSSIDLGQITSIPGTVFAEKWGPFRDPSSEWRNVFTVQIPSTVTRIEGSAFRQAGIEHITIPSSVTFISSNAFHAQKAPKVDFSSTPVCFGLNPDLDHVFYFSYYDLDPSIPIVKRGLKTLTFEAGSQLTEIGSSAFSHNELVSVNLPESVTKVNYSVFYANRLSSFTWNNTSSVWLSENIFAYNEITDISGFLPNGNWTAYVSSTLYQVQNAIPARCFTGNLLSGTITIPSNVTRIANQAFTQNNITTANVPTGCIVDSGAFDAGVTIVYY